LIGFEIFASAVTDMQNPYGVPAVVEFVEDSINAMALAEQEAANLPFRFGGFTGQRISVL
jgi:hypothetical protein